MHQPWKIIVLVLLTCGVPASTSKKDPIPRQTPEPINIDSKQTSRLITPKPLTFKGNNGHEKAYLRNTGTVVKVDLFESNTTNVVTGGPLDDTIYVYTEIKFYWTNETNGVAYTTVNGENGSPLEVAIIYYNPKYESHYNALNHRDGIAEVLFRIKIGSKSNPAFEPFAAAMKRIQKPGPPVEIKLYDAFSWFYNFPFYSRYFTYPGSQTNETLEEIFYCTTTMAFGLHPSQYISKNQFEKTFLKLLGTDEKPLTNQAQQYPRGSRKVTRSRGIFKKISNKIYPSFI